MEENRESLLSSLSPQDGMEFSTIDEAWMFWVSYGGMKGFEVRKRYTNKRKSDGKVRSCRFVCANEGHRSQDKRDYLTKRPRAETRTDCQVRMGVSLDKKGKYKVSDLILEHNHILHLPETSHLMVSQRKISEVQGFEIETAHDAGIRPKAAHGLATLQVGGSHNLSYTLRDHKNYLCGHALKVLHLMNIKALPTHYVEKRWTREARSGTVQDKQGRNIIENPRFDNMLRYKNMTRKFLNVADRAASYPSCTLLVNSTIDILSKQVEEQINGFSSTMNPVTVSLNVTPPSEVSTAQLKKKEVETKTSKRKRSWIEKMHKGSKKGRKKNEKRSVEPNPTNVALDNGAAVQNISPATSSPTEGMSEPYIAINTFSGLLMAPITNDFTAEF